MTSRMTRRVLIQTTSAAAGTGAFGILTRRGDAAEFTWRYADEMVPTHSMNVHLQQAAERIRRDSGGRMEIQIFPNNQLGGATDMLSQLRTGVIQLLNLSGVILSTVVPVASINGIGFGFKEYDNVWAAMDGALGGHVRGAIEKAGLLAFEKMWDNGYRLQRQMKSGLPSLAALGFFDAGFADRVVAQAMAETFPDVVDRYSARVAIRNGAGRARELLARYPAYFESVLDELLV